MQYFSFSFLFCVEKKGKNFCLLCRHLQDNQLSGTLDVLENLPLNDLYFLISFISLKFLYFMWLIGCLSISNQLSLIFILLPFVILLFVVEHFHISSVLSFPFFWRITLVFCLIVNSVLLFKTLFSFTLRKEWKKNCNNDLVVFGRERM